MSEEPAKARAVGLPFGWRAGAKIRDEEPACPSCGAQMRHKKDVHINDNEEGRCGHLCFSLWQCPECKSIETD